MTMMSEQLVVRRIHARAKRLERLIEMRAPETIIEKERHLVRQAIDWWLSALEQKADAPPETGIVP